MNDKFPGAITLGYAALFISIWLFTIPSLGWVETNAGEETIPILLILGGAVLFIAGIFSFFNESKIDSVIFFVFVATIVSYSLRLIMYPILRANTEPAGIDGWIQILVAAVIFYLWMASFKGNSIKQLFLLFSWISILGGAIHNWSSSIVFGYIGGYVGLVASLLAGWYSASTVLPKKESTQTTT